MNTRWPTAAPFLSALLLAACSATPGDAPDRSLVGARIGGPFALTDQDGHAVTDRSYAGRYRIVYFGYTFCPDVCPTDLQKIGAGLKLFEQQAPALGAKVTPIFVTVDPARDTPAVVKEYVRNFHPRMVGLTGSPDAIAAAEKDYGVYARKGPVQPGGAYLMDHTVVAYLMDPSDKPLVILPADQYGSPEAVAAALTRWVK